MRPLVPASTFQVLLSKAASNFKPWEWTQDDIMAYVKADALKPGLPVVVLLVLCILTLLLLVLW